MVRALRNSLRFLYGPAYACPGLLCPTRSMTSKFIGKGWTKRAFPYDTAEAAFLLERRLRARVPPDPGF